MKTALILCAGNQTRFGSNVPKALYKFPNSDLCPLDVNINSVKNYVQEVIVLTSFNNNDHFLKYNDVVNNVKVQPIHSGKGCGDAVLKGLKYCSNDDITLIWGDSIQSESNVSELHKIPFNSIKNIAVPVKMEKNPYVQFKYDGKVINRVLFSKRHDPIDKYGYHDLSIFRFDKTFIFNLLKEYSKVHTSELVFLDIFNQSKFESTLLDMSNNDSITNYSYNTVDEFLSLMTKGSFKCLKE